MAPDFSAGGLGNAPGSNQDHKHDFMPDDIIEAMRKAGAGWVLVENEDRDQDNEYSFFQAFRKTAIKEHLIRPWRRPTKSCLVSRYGAYGDMMIASSILPGPAPSKPCSAAKLPCVGALTKKPKPGLT